MRHFGIFGYYGGIILDILFWIFLPIISGFFVVVDSSKNNSYYFWIFMSFLLAGISVFVEYIFFKAKNYFNDDKKKGICILLMIASGIISYFVPLNIKICPEIFSSYYSLSRDFYYYIYCVLIIIEIVASIFVIIGLLKIAGLKKYKVVGLTLLTLCISALIISTVGIKVRNNKCEQISEKLIGLKFENKDEKKLTKWYFKFDNKESNKVSHYTNNGSIASTLYDDYYIKLDLFGKGEPKFTYGPYSFSLNYDSNGNVISLADGPTIYYLVK